MFFSLSFRMASTKIKSKAATIRFGLACVFRLLPLLLLLLPTVAEAQFNYTTNADGTTITITGYTGSGGAVNIPSTINGLTNVSIGDSAFYQCFSLTSVTIPNSVTNIGAGAFAFCNNLTNVTIPSSVTYINVAAFYYCTSLNGVYFQGNAPDIFTNPPGIYGLGVFDGDGEATAFFLPGTTGWDSNFAGLSTWSSDYKTNNGTITIIGYAGFGGAVTIPTMIYGLPVATIGINAFAYCNNLMSVTIPNSVTNIGDEAFYLCTNLITLYFQGNAPSIGSNVFYGITNAIVYFLPGTTGWGSIFDGLTAWELYPFNYTINNGMITITGYTGGGEVVNIPNTIIGLPVIGIGDYAFEDDDTLTGVTIPNSITKHRSVGVL
jgi:hypothetical protein